MADHAKLAEMIPWFVNETLSSEDRRRVEEHLPDCAECRATLEDARDLKTIGGQEAENLLDHVQAQHLESFATDPRSVDRELAGWIRVHLSTCEVCRDALRIHRALNGLEDLRDPRVHPRVGQTEDRDSHRSSGASKPYRCCRGPPPDQKVCS